HGPRSVFLQRFLLAATLSSNYGIYGPAFELMENVPRPGSEEYIDNEKFELKAWDIDRADSLREVITVVNRIRRDNPALQQMTNITFHPTDNLALMCFSKKDPLSGNVVIV